MWYYYFSKEYFFFLGAILLCAAFSAVASMRVRSAFEKNSRVPCRSGMTGADAARRLLHAYGAADVEIGKVAGNLSDHYHPKREIVNLSESTYDHATVAAVAVAAHEIGHVMQKRDGYGFYKLRTALVPVVNFGSYLAFPLVLVGLLLDMLVASVNENVGFAVAMVGVALYGASFLFALVTLPVELNASRRAGKMLLAQGVLVEEEMPAVREVLSAAALTYLASLATSLVYFLRFFFYVMSIFGRRRR